MANTRRPLKTSVSKSAYPEATPTQSSAYPNDPSPSGSSSENAQGRSVSRTRLRQLFAALACFALFTLVALLQPMRELPHPHATPGTLAFWFYPVVTNEFTRLPCVVVNGSSVPNFLALWVGNDKDIWIGGTQGVLVYSPDGGRSWRQLPPPLPVTAQPATASASRPSWSLIPAVEASSGDPVPQSAPANSQSSPTQNPAQPDKSQQVPAAPLSLNGSLVEQSNNPSSANPQNIGSAAPSDANRQNTPVSNPAPQSSFPQNSQQLNPGPTASRTSVPSTPDRRQGATPAQTQSLPSSVPESDCSFAGAALQYLYFANRELGFVVFVKPNADQVTRCFTRDGGTTWRSPASSDDQTFREADRVWNSKLTFARVVLPGGKLINLEGKSFDYATSGIVPNFSSNGFGKFGYVQFVDNSVGVAVGLDGIVIKTIDGGKHWFPLLSPGQPSLPSHKLPAPWYYVSWLIVGVVALPSLRKPHVSDLQSEESIANIGVSDRPLEPTDLDPLGYRNLALSISRFLRNENTIAPITIAITGDWGTGKSSIMNLLRRDLAARGFRPIWFNAWHNQTEDDLFATILQAIRKQGVPRWWDPDYLPFRLRLLAGRWRTRWQPVTILLIAIAFLAGYEWRNPESHSIETFIESFRSWDKLISAIKGLHGAFWTLLVCVLIAAKQLYDGLKAFGADPASLLASKSGATRLSDLEKQTALRQKFGEELKEVTEALGKRRRIVLFIDDLDRCMPENIRVALEAINFIVTSGECYVVMGLARRPVEAGVGLSFEKVAAEMTWSLATKDETAEELAKRKRWQFSRQYLDKLINIEIPARPASGAHFEDLVLGSGKAVEPPASIARYAPLVLRILLPVAISALFIVSASLVGFWIAQPEREQPDQSVAVTTAQNQPAQTASQATVLPKFAASGSATPAAPAASYSILAPVPSATGLSTWSFPLLALAILLYACWRLLSQKEDVLVKDSPHFRLALEIWDSLIVQTHATPRSTKRFMNRVRCLAMRLRPATESRSRWRVLWQSARALPETSSTESSMPESMLVALSAIYDIAPEIVRNDKLYFTALHGTLETLSQGEVAIDQRIEQTFRDAMNKHASRFGTEWPPSTDQRALFLDMCADVTVRG